MRRCEILKPWMSSHIYQ